MLVGGDLAHPAARAQLDAGADRVRPVGDVGARLGALRAARRAMAEIDAGRAAVVVGGGDGGVGRPPVPAQLVHRLGVARAGLAERDRRHRRMARRHAGIAGEAGHAHHAVVLGEERLQRPVVDRPVVGDAVERLHPEIRRVHARPVRRVDDRAAADAVEVGDLHRRVVVVDRIIGVAPAAVRADVEIGVAPRLPVAAVAGEVGGLHPVALLQAEDAHPGLGQAPGHRGARGAGADDQHIDHLVAGHLSAPRRHGPVVAPERRALAHGVEQRPVALFERVALGEGRAGLQPERQQHAVVAVVGAQDHPPERRGRGAAAGGVVVDQRFPGVAVRARRNGPPDLARSPPGPRGTRGRSRPWPSRYRRGWRDRRRRARRSGGLRGSSSRRCRRGRGFQRRRVWFRRRHA